MLKHSQDHVRILRKRKIHQKTIEETDQKVINVTEYNVLTEHNYCHVGGKKNCRWPDIKIVPKNSIEILLDKSTNDYRDSDSLPDYLKGFISSSDEEYEEESNKQVKSISLLLKMELKKELSIKGQKKKHVQNSSSRSLNLKDASLVNHHNLTNKQSKIVEFINCHKPSNLPKNSKDLINNIEGYFTNVGKPTKSSKFVPVFTNDATVFRSKNLSELKKISLKEYKKNAKLKTKKLLSCDELLLNKKIKKDLFDSSKNNLLKSLSFSKIMVDMQSSKEKPWSPCISSIINNVPKLPKNIPPPFEWFHIVYLAIKNSTTEYTTCQGIQHFSRCWFPYYSEKSWIKTISMTLQCYNKKYFNYVSLKIKTDEYVIWTVKNESVNALESKLTSIVEKFDIEIKAAMRSPDQLSLLLKGYGVFNLGYKAY